MSTFGGQSSSSPTPGGTYFSASAGGELLLRFALYYSAGWLTSHYLSNTGTSLVWFFGVLFRIRKTRRHIGTGPLFFV